jgi:hypothetical protein
MMIRDSFIQFTVVGLECSDIIISTIKSLNIFLNRILQTSESNSQVHDFHILNLRELNTIVLTKFNLKNVNHFYTIQEIPYSEALVLLFCVYLLFENINERKSPNIFQKLQLFADFEL